jgi:phosphate transport system substrate-binding protein
MTHFFFLCYVAVGALLLACQQPTRTPDNSPPAVKVHPPTHILADMQLRPVLEAALLPYAQASPAYPVRITYLAEDQAVAAFLADSAHTLLLSRPLLEAEDRLHRSRYNTPPQERPLCTGAVLLVAHPAVADTDISLQQLHAILNSRTAYWRNGQAILPACDGGSSSNLRTLFRQLDVKVTQVKHLYATGSDSATLAYVARTPHALGMVGYEALADLKDPAVQRALAQVRVLAVTTGTGQPAYRLATEDAVQHLAKDRYPLARHWRILTRAGSQAAGTAFATYLTSSIGQRLLYKCGLMPADPPGRDVTLQEAPMPQFD